jgi:hypothetical protein
VAKRDSPGWGKVNAGQPWGIIACDVDRALARARMNDYEQILMQIIREFSWGKSTRQKVPGKKHPWPEAIPYPWCPGDLAMRLGLPDSRLCEAKRHLVGSKMVVESRGGLLINKNADQWIFPNGHPRAGQPRLDEKALVYAMGARPDLEPATPGPEIDPEGIRPELRESVIPVTEIRNAELRESVTPVTETRNPGYGNAERQLRRPVTPLSSKGARNSDPTGLDKKSIPTECTNAAGAGAAIQVMDRNGDVIDTDQGISNDPKEVRRVIDLADDDLFPGMYFGAQVNAYRKMWPIAWIERALVDARAWPVPPRSFTPIVNKLRQWTRDGGPPEPLTPLPGPAPTGPAGPPPSKSELRRKALTESIHAWAAELAEESKDENP